MEMEYMLMWNKVNINLNGEEKLVKEKAVL